MLRNSTTLSRKTVECMIRFHFCYIPHYYNLCKWTNGSSCLHCLTCTSRLTTSNLRSSEQASNLKKRSRGGVYFRVLSVFLCGDLSTKKLKWWKDLVKVGPVSSCLLKWREDLTKVVRSSPCVRHTFLSLPSPRLHTTS
jgi:hypothetical protein